MKYAINKNNETINIKDASNGKSCNCVCKCCGEPVLAKQGKIKDWHFAHISKIECKYSNNPGETDLHILAKEVFKKNKSIYVPSVYYDPYGADIEVFKGSKIDFDKVELEKRVDKFTPDIIAHKGNEQIWIEIAVTHFTEKNKIDYCRENNITLIEIDLSDIDRDTSEDNLNYLIVNTDDYVCPQGSLYERRKRLLWSTKLFNKVNNNYAVDLNDYNDLTNYLSNGLNKFFLGYPLIENIDKDFIKERIKTLEDIAKSQSYKRLENSKRYIKNCIKDINHLKNWWKNEQTKRMTKENVKITPHPDLESYVDAKACIFIDSGEATTTLSKGEFKMAMFKYKDKIEFLKK
jgi:hypothetical protein